MGSKRKTVMKLTHDLSELDTVSTCFYTSLFSLGRDFEMGELNAGFIDFASKVPERLRQCWEKSRHPSETVTCGCG